MELAARPATPADVDCLADLAAAAVAEQREARGGAVWAAREARAVPAEASLAADVAADDCLVLVGTIDETPVGYLVAHTEPLRDGRVLGLLDDVYVDAGAREVGIGELLVEEALDWCRSFGCVGIDVVVLPGNRSTKNFFESMGFTARSLTVHKRLT